MERKITKEKIIATVDIEAKEELERFAKEQRETFSSVTNDCIKLGLPEYKFFMELKKSHLESRQKAMKEKTNKLKKVSNEDSPQRSPSSEVVTSSELNPKQVDNDK